MIFRFENDLKELPSPELSEEDGLIGIGASLDPDFMMRAYSKGIFPWFDWIREPEPLWYGPRNRFVIFPEEIHVSHSMRQLINSGRLTCTIDKAFSDVVCTCGAIDGRMTLEGAWLGEEMMIVMDRLHGRGFARSVEVWEDGELVGGLYGICRGLEGIPNDALFIGESMFSKRPSASKMALIHLARTMQQTGGRLIDCQIETPHLRTMGARHIPYREYMAILTS